MGAGIDCVLSMCEKAVEIKAAEYAYQLTNNIEEPETQRTTYKLIKESIILGARMAQEYIIENKDLI